jgi:hypothetical protein
MRACRMVVGETVLPACDQLYHAEQGSHRRVEPDPVRAVAQPDSQSLSHLVFDGPMLVAAFARRDDAKQWVEQCGHPAMKLRRMRALARPLRSKKARADKASEKTSRAVVRRR